MTHFSQTFNINTRNNHKRIFSCNLWCVGVTFPWRHIELQQVGFGVFFSLSSFCPTRFGKKYDLFSLFGKQNGYFSKKSYLFGLIQYLSV